MIRRLIRLLLCLFGFHECETVDRIHPVPFPAPIPGGSLAQYRFYICKRCGRVVRTEKLEDPPAKADRR